MASSMITWLNNTLKLSKQITDIEKDFADAFLFSEVISQVLAQNFLLQLQPGYLTTKRFILTDISKKREDKLNNFKLLERSFNELDIKMDIATADQIIKEEKGQALRILFQMKRVFL